MKKYNATVIILIIIIVLIAVKFTFLKPPSENKPGNNAGKSAVAVNTIIVSTSDPGNKILATGTILANEEVELKPEASGKITHIFFKEGTAVKKGDLLVKINDADLLAQLKKQESEIQLAKEKVNRAKKLLDVKGISQEECDVASNERSSLEAEREITIANVAKTEIRAPFDGLIGLKSVSEGSYVSPQIGIAILQQVNPVKVDFSIPEKYAGNINAGDEIDFTVAGNKEVFRGKIYATESQIDILTRSLKIRAICANENRKIIPGSFAEIELRIKEKNKSIMIPTQAIVPVLKGKQVFLFEGGIAQSRNVETGIRNDTVIQILSGLNEGDTLIVSGLMQITNGAPVKMIKVN